eukprot:9784725-Karenia_brevis.AAC.1
MFAPIVVPDSACLASSVGITQMLVFEGGAHSASNSKAGRCQAFSFIDSCSNGFRLADRTSDEL